ncbi:hypothetical protein BD324DRAFT_657709 [Kockovaella imperatae]|uniref:Beta-lactamase superfamily domain-domain-containing protein n=1 Tax=Kockovaella imperatae TaxID=4999 RepID=A0A1Y1U9Y2_9TREE|nr:hypothetical protein BD324DRAFT_657709 [Kockovaella imperatae]ORX34840.1 hypothetical protein BD324DRAFT_657709 [Kockovaella imperatae]
MLSALMIRNCSAIVLTIVGAIMLALSVHVWRSVEPIHYQAQAFSFNIFVGAWTLSTEMVLLAFRYFGVNLNITTEMVVLLVSSILWLVSGDLTSQSRSGCSGSPQQGLAGVCSELQASFGFIWIAFTWFVILLGYLGFEMYRARSRDETQVWRKTLMELAERRSYDLESRSEDQATYVRKEREESPKMLYPFHLGAMKGRVWSLSRKDRQSLRRVAPFRMRQLLFFELGSDELRVLWIGHATVYLQCRGISILFDPVWSKRCSPCPLVGPKRGLDPPCRISDLPFVHIVVISHDHYKKSIQNIERHFVGVRYFVPLGLRRILEHFGVVEDRVVEMAWWEESIWHRTGMRTTISEPSEIILSACTGMAAGTPVIQRDGASDSVSIASSPTLVNEPSKTMEDREEAVNEKQEQLSYIRLVCTPAQHCSGRNPFKRNRTLWSSWFLELPRPGEEPWRIYFGG